MIHKTGKRITDPASYRPVSLLSNIGKLLEKIITNSLYDWAEELGKLNNIQSGFRKNKSTNDQLFRLTQAIIEGFNRKHITTAIFLDVEKAFDRVWHKGLLEKLRRIDTPPTLLRIIASFFRDRDVWVKKQNYIFLKSPSILVSRP